MDPRAAAGMLLAGLAAALAASACRDALAARVEALGRPVLSFGPLGGLRARLQARAAALGLADGDADLRAGLALLLASSGLLLSPLGPIFPLLGALAATIPFVLLERAWTDRTLRMEAELPWILDFLAMGVRAGLDFEVALERAARLRPGPLATEIQVLLSRVRMGTPRREALLEWGGRSGLPALQAFTGTLAQADASGGALGPVLKVQAESARTARLQRAELAAQKTPVKLLFPLVLCIFPVTFLVLFGPLLFSVLS